MRVGRERLKKILAIIGDMYPEARGELEWETPFQLLIAVILSAQTTDKAVNKVTPNLWKHYPEIEDLAKANLVDVEECLRTIGLYKNKALNIIKTARVILQDFDGQVPKTHKELETLPGVGRKTANVVLAEVYGIPSIAVDTHVSRIAKRLNISAPDADVKEIEEDLMKKIPKKDWILTHHKCLPAVLSPPPSVVCSPDSRYIPCPAW